MSAPDQGRTRLNVTLSARTMARLEQLKEATDAPSITEVIKKALLTFESIADHLSKGASFAVRFPDGEVCDVEFLIDVEKPRPALKLVKSDEHACILNADISGLCMVCGKLAN